MIARASLLVLVATLSTAVPPIAAPRAMAATIIAPDTATTTRFVVDGIPVILRRNTSNDVVAANLYLLGGTRQLTPQTAGIEAMLLIASERGTRKYPGATVRQKLARIGSSITLEANDDWSQIGLHAIRLSLRAHDGRIAHTPLSRDLMSRFGNDAFAVIAWAERASATEFASFAPRVLEHAENGDALAIRIAVNAARQIGAMVSNLTAITPRVCLLGGLAAPLRKWLEPQLQQALTSPVHDAVAGALLLARRNAICERLRQTAATTFLDG